MQEPAIKFSDRVFKELNIGPPTQLPVIGSNAEARAIVEDNKDNLGRQPAPEKTTTVKA
jgi:hypothetical protein